MYSFIYSLSPTPSIFILSHSRQNAACFEPKMIKIRPVVPEKMTQQPRNELLELFLKSTGLVRRCSGPTSVMFGGQLRRCSVADFSARYHGIRLSYPCTCVFTTSVSNSIQLPYIYSKYSNKLEVVSSQCPKSNLFEPSHSPTIPRKLAHQTFKVFELLC